MFYKKAVLKNFKIFAGKDLCWSLFLIKLQYLNKSKITSENTFNGDHFEIEGNHESSKDEKTLFWVFLQICDPCFNP